LASRLFKEMSCRLRKRLKRNKPGSQIDFRKTFRKNIEKGGVPLQLLFKGPHLQKDKMILFLDVSGSMDKYSFFLLRFVLSLRDHFKNLEAFVFSTRLLRISRILQRKGIAKSLKELSERADTWSGGTRIGACFLEFNAGWSKLLNKSNSVVIIVSDGLDTGDPAILRQELAKIKRRSKKIIWLNPLKGMESYAPVARGMSAALPLVDEFGSAHNLDSIMKLEKYFANV